MTSARPVYVSLTRGEVAWLKTACFSIGSGAGDRVLVDAMQRSIEAADASTTTACLVELLRGTCVSADRTYDGAAVALVGRWLAEKCFVCEALQDESLLTLGSCELLCNLRRSFPELFEVIRDQVFAETGVSLYDRDDEPNERLPTSLLQDLCELTVVQKWSVLEVFDAMRQP